MKNNENKTIKNETVISEWSEILFALLLSLSLILLAQYVKFIKNPEKSTPITKDTFVGLVVLGIITIIGIIIQKLVQKQPIQIIKDFPVLGWVSMTSLFFCLIFPFAIKAIHSVDFLGITTTILTFAGLSIANRLGDLKKVSWKIVIVGTFVFIGTYLGSALIAHIGLLLTGR